MKQLSIYTVTSLFVLLSVTSAQAPQPSLLQILANRSVFGKDFPAALASVPAWAAVEERRVVVLAHEVVGGTPFTTKEEAEKRALRLRQALQNRVTFRPGTPLAESSATLSRVQAISFPEDDSVRVAVSDSSPELIAPQLTPARLKEELGQPEKIIYVTVQNKYERRPIELTVYEYAGGQISFAESSPSLRPGFIDRAILDVRAINAAVFQEAK